MGQIGVRPVTSRATFDGQRRVLVITDSPKTMPVEFGDMGIIECVSGNAQLCHALTGDTYPSSDPAPLLGSDRVQEGWNIAHARPLYSQNIEAAPGQMKVIDPLRSDPVHNKDLHVGKHGHVNTGVAL